MQLLVTGHDGYLGSVMVPVLERAGHRVTGLDTFLYEECGFGPHAPGPPALRMDLRDVQPDNLRGFDAVIHLAALCNDPLGDQHPATTFAINQQGSTRLAEASRSAGVARFLFASSCSLYGVAGDELLTESAPFRPITAYGRSKVLAEAEIAGLSDDRFSPVFLRNATAYGVSPKLRCDIVVNNLVAHAVTRGEVLIQSDGSPWRPLVHAEDIARAFLAVLEAPRSTVHNQAFNVGRNDDNLRVRDIAQLVQDIVPGCRIRYAEGGGPDPRCYRVDCTKLARAVPDFRPEWRVRSGIEQLYHAYRDAGFTASDFESDRYIRLRHIRRLQESGRLDTELRWLPAAVRR